MREGTLKELNVKVGDKVRPLINPRGQSIQGGQLMLITSVDFNYGWCSGRTANRPWQQDIRLSDQIIFRLEEEAMEFKVGDEVLYKDGLDTILCKVLAADTYWAVINYLGGRPWVVNKEDVRKPKPTPVMKEVVRYGRVSDLGNNSFPMGWTRDSLDTHKITFNLVDGEPDCNSIKMIKL